MSRYVEISRSVRLLGGPHKQKLGEQAWDDQQNPEDEAVLSQESNRKQQKMTFPHQTKIPTWLPRSNFLIGSSGSSISQDGTPFKRLIPKLERDIFKECPEHLHVWRCALPDTARSPLKIGWVFSR